MKKLSNTENTETTATDAAPPAETAPSAAPKKSKGYMAALKAEGLTVGEGSRAKTVDPKGVKIAGIDFEADDKDPLFDERAVRAQAKEAPFYDATMVADMKEHGWDGAPIECVVRDGVLVVKDGRRRTVHARFAGLESVEFFVRDGEADDKALFLAVRRANARRLNESPISLARSAARAKEQWGVTIAEFARSVGVAEPLFRSYMALLKLAPTLLALVELDEKDPKHLNSSVAIQLAKIGKDEKDQEKRWALQVEAYEKLAAAGNLTTAAARREKSAGKGGDGGEGDEGADGDEGGDEGGSKADKGDAANKLTTAEIRKIVKIAKGETTVKDSDGNAIELSLDETALKVLRIIIGDLSPANIKGMAKAFKAVRGEL